MPKRFNQYSRRQLWFILILILSLAAGACAKEKAPPETTDGTRTQEKTGESATKHPHACDLVPQADLETAVGQPITDVQRAGEHYEGAPQETQCLYSTGQGNFSISLMDHSRSFDSRKDQENVGPLEPVEGLGEEAHWSGGVLHVKVRDDAYLGVTMLLSGEGTKERAIEVARLAIPKL